MMNPFFWVEFWAEMMRPIAASVLEANSPTYYPRRTVHPLIKRAAQCRAIVETGEGPRR